MTMTSMGQTERPPAARSDSPESGKFPATLIGAFFIIMGMIALLWLAIAVASSQGIREALGLLPTADGERPSLVMAFLTQFGIVLPLLVIGLSIMSIWLGIWLRSRNVIAARWAQVALSWLTAAALFIAFFNLVRILFTSYSRRTFQVDPAYVLPLIVSAVGGLVFFLILMWLNRNIDRVFFGQEQLGSRETRLAWTLLIPTLAVFVLVAARPLEQTFIRSVTDKRFASAEVPSFVGLQNYQDLLSVRFDVVPCRMEEGADICVTSPDGSIRWASIDREQLLAGYRTVWHIPLPAGETPRSLAISGQDADFIKSVWTTLLFAVASVSLELIIAMFMALTVNSSFAGRGLMRAVMLIPWAIPTVVAARLWELMLKDTSAGIINRVLMDLRIIDAPQAWLSDVSMQLSTAVLVDAWKTAPFVALLLLAGLQSISADLYEAASVDGATKVRQFWTITLPLLRPTIAVALVFRTLDALRVFDLFNVLFGRQQLSMATFNYETLVNNQLDGYASAVSIILFILISVFAIFYVRALNVETN
jgi:trehalose/maltose transport system permease protein